jgi:UDP-N-acetylmuramyl pentapeptide phosphotransferase/UDP-N-acetylglucosamine-1-phosphate transferase
MTGSLILFLGFISAFIVVFLATPSLIKVAKLKHLVDEPKEKRKMHGWSIPTIGGIVIFGSIIFSYALWFPEKYNHIPNMLSNFKALIACLIILFFVGIKDDIIGTAPAKKLIAHFVVGFILVIMADIRIYEMQGIFGINEDLDLWQSYLLSFFVYIVIMNAINLIDGLDGLAAGIGLIAAIAFGLIFYYAGNIPLSLLAYVLAGSLFGFLIFNFSPARIFMGDSGSLLIGVILCVLAINTISQDYSNSPEWLSVINKPVLAMSILVYPLIDTIRVFSLRVIRGKSPLLADKNHIHHHLSKMGLSHISSVLILYFYTLLIIGLQFLFQLYFEFDNPTLVFFLQLGSAVGIISTIFLIKKIKT